MDELIGRSLGQYRIDEILGRGGMATVFKAYQPALDRFVAVKVLPPQLALDPQFSQRFTREARQVARLSHPNIVSVYDFGEADGYTYIVMKHIPGGTLKDFMAAHGRLTFQHAAQIIAQIGSALDHAHEQGVVHRDIKPANVLLERPDWALLSDFGLVKTTQSATHLTSSGMSLGTPEYMAPEQAHGIEADARADIYSLGVMLFAMVTGEVPYKGDTPIAVMLKHVNAELPHAREVIPELPLEADTLIRKALAKDPNDRPSSAGEFSQKFGNAVSSLSGPTPIESTYPLAQPATMTHRRSDSETPSSTPSQPQATRQARFMMLGGLALIAAIIIGVIAIAGGQRPADTSPTPNPAITPDVTLPTNTGLNLPIQSVVEIWARVNIDGALELAWSGSGSIISSDGLILTNAHVVLDDKEFGKVEGLEIWITRDADNPPQPTFLAETLVADPDLDLAVIKITTDLAGNPVDAATLSALSVAQIADSDALQLGDEVYILGYPGIGGDNITFTQGSVAGFTNQPGVKGRAFIKTDATIAGGNSGGFASNHLGQLIAVPTQLGYGGDDQYVDCRKLVDTNDDGAVDSNDSCVPTGGFINALRPINLALPFIQQAQQGVVSIPTSIAPEREPIDVPTNAGEVLFSDSFDNNDADWDVADRSDARVAVAEGVLQIDVYDSESVEWSNAGLDFADLDIEIDTQRLSGPLDNAFGILFRYQDEDNFYLYLISTDGFYQISKFVDGEIVHLVDWTATDLIDQETEANRIGVQALGNELTVFVNGVQLDQVLDDSYSTGDIGLIGVSFSEGGVSIAFDDLFVRVPGGSHDEIPLEPDSIEAELIFADDFSGDTRGWFIDSSDSVTREIGDGEFHIEVLESSFSGWSELPDVVLGDVIVEVDARRESGADLNGFGVLCRFQDADNFYALLVGSDGTYTIYRYLDGEFASLVDWSESDAILPDDVNHLRAECIGDQLRLFANDVELAGVVDAALSSGTVALTVQAFDEGNLRIAFDNVSISTLAATTSAGGPVLFTDDFSSTDSGWDRADDESATTDYLDGRYVISVRQSTWLAWANPSQFFEDVIVDVDARQIDGPDDNNYGVLCRYQDTSNFYRILISGDGYYTFLKYVDGESSSLVKWTATNAINQGNASNHLSVTCEGNRLALSINGQFVAETFDDSFSDGDIGLTAGAYDEPGVSVSFDNVVVTQP